MISPSREDQSMRIPRNAATDDACPTSSDLPNPVALSAVCGLFDVAQFKECVIAIFSLLIASNCPQFYTAVPVWNVHSSNFILGRGGVLHHSASDK